MLEGQLDDRRISSDPARETLFEPTARDVVKRTATHTVACASVDVPRKDLAQISFASFSSSRGDWMSAYDMLSGGDIHI